MKNTVTYHDIKFAKEVAYDVIEVEITDAEAKLACERVEAVSTTDTYYENLKEYFYA